MNPGAFFPFYVVPGLDLLVNITEGKIKRSKEADVMVMAICGQEGDWRHRRQVGGPARGFSQFEQGGGVAGVMTHPATASHAKKLFEYLDIGEPSLGPFVQPSQRTVYEAMAWNDLLHIGMARLNLWWAAPPLPAIGQQDAAWAYYINCWRPGKPHPETWPDKYAKARAAVGV